MTTTTVRSLRTLGCDLYGRGDCGHGRQFEMSLGGARHASGPDRAEQVVRL